MIRLMRPTRIGQVARYFLANCQASILQVTVTGLETGTTEFYGGLPPHLTQPGGAIPHGVFRRKHQGKFHISAGAAKE